MTRKINKIEQVVKLVSSGFKDGEVVVLKKINPHRAKIVATQLGLIGKHLKLIEREIQRVVAQGEIVASGLAVSLAGSIRAGGPSESCQVVDTLSRYDLQ